MSRIPGLAMTSKNVKSGYITGRENTRTKQIITRELERRGEKKKLLIRIGRTR
jgi:hypothetical protein